MALTRKKKWMIIAAVVILVVFVGLAAVQASKGKEEAGMMVETAEIVKQDIDSHIFTSGEVYSLEKRDITADLSSGKVLALHVKEGDTVQAGQVVAELDTTDIAYEIKQAEIKLSIEQESLEKMRKANKTRSEIELDNAKIAYADAERAYNQNKVLYESAAISKSEMDSAKSKFEKAHNDLVLAEANFNDVEDDNDILTQEKNMQLSEMELQKLKDDLEKCKIKSPISGTVVEVAVNEGSNVTQTTPIMQILNVDNLEIETKVSEYDVVKVKEGQPVKITGEAFAGQEYSGKIKLIGAAAVSVNTGQGQETIVEVKVEVTDKNTAMKPGFTANVNILTANKKDVLVVPYEAIFTRKNGDKVIFTVVDGKAKEHIIKTGVESDLVVEVISKDLKEKDKVIMNPSEKLKDGDPVKENKVMDHDKNTAS
ncbi:MAG: efflux RND transporter periplasmic adaptor subunit [Bacillota bacterium]